MKRSPTQIPPVARVSYLDYADKRPRRAYEILTIFLPNHGRPPHVHPQWPDSAQTGAALCPGSSTDDPGSMACAYRRTPADRALPVQAVGGRGSTCQIARSGAADMAGPRSSRARIPAVIWSGLGIVPGQMAFLRRGHVAAAALEGGRRRDPAAGWWRAGSAGGRAGGRSGRAGSGFRPGAG